MGLFFLKQLPILLFNNINCQKGKQEQGSHLARLLEEIEMEVGRKSTGIRVCGWVRLSFFLVEVGRGSGLIMEVEAEDCKGRRF